MTNPRQGVVSNSYDAPSRVLTQTLPLTRTLQFAYRPCGTACSGTTVTDTRGVATVYTYDGNRLVTLVANPGPHEARWSFTYSPQYRWRRSPAVARHTTTTPSSWAVSAP